MTEYATCRVSIAALTMFQVGGLQEVLDVVRKHQLNMKRIESRPSKTPKWDYDFFVDFAAADEKVRSLPCVAVALTRTRTHTCRRLLGWWMS